MNAEWIWDHEHERVYNKVIEDVDQVAELSHFKRNKILKSFATLVRKAQGQYTTESKGEWKPISLRLTFILF